jgi:flagellar basal-body rod protein FlgB
MDINSDVTQAFLVRLLDVTAKRHKVLSNNIANAETPGFLRRDISFESELANAVEHNDPASFRPELDIDRSPPARADGNNITIDLEMAEMNKNAMLQQISIQMLQTKLAMQRMAIQGR